MMEHPESISRVYESTTSLSESPPVESTTSLSKNKIHLSRRIHTLRRSLARNHEFFDEIDTLSFVIRSIFFATALGAIGKSYVLWCCGQKILAHQHAKSLDKVSLIVLWSVVLYRAADALLVLTIPIAVGITLYYYLPYEKRNDNITYNTICCLLLLIHIDNIALNICTMMFIACTHMYPTLMKYIS